MANGNAGKLCPYCQTRFGGNEPVTVCTRCGIPHHPDCWQENGGCTTFGCVGDAPTGMAPRQVYPAAGSYLPSAAPATPEHLDITLDDLSVCANCGASVSVWDEQCRHCGGSTSQAPTQQHAWGATGLPPNYPGYPPGAYYAGANKAYKSPAAACLLNLLLLGAGYFYLGQVGKGLLVLLIGILALLFTCSYFGLGFLAVLVYAMIDCFETARRMNGQY